jgi:hypothetical protein
VAEKRTNETAEAMREFIAAWNQVYGEALKRGPHNPKGTAERAEELTRAYFSGWLRTKGTR